MRGDNISTVEGIQYCGGIPSVLWGDNSSTCGGKLQYCGGYLQYCGGYSVQWGITSVQWGDSFNTLEGIHYIRGKQQYMCWDNISTVGDNISTVEGIQYTGGWILILACLVINNDEKISTFLYYDTKSFGSQFENSRRFHAFWELDWCTPGPTLFRNNLQFYFRSALSLFQI